MRTCASRLERSSCISQCDLLHSFILLLVDVYMVFRKRVY
jgi:hypothetical protein